MVTAFFLLLADLLVVEDVGLLIVQASPFVYNVLSAAVSLAVSVTSLKAAQEAFTELQDLVDDLLVGFGIPFPKRPEMCWIISVVAVVLGIASVPALGFTHAMGYLVVMWIPVSILTFMAGKEALRGVGMRIGKMLKFVVSLFMELVRKVLPVGMEDVKVSDPLAALESVRKK